MYAHTHMESSKKIVSEIVPAQDTWKYFLPMVLTKSEWALTIIFIKAIKTYNYKNANKNLSFKNL